MRSVKYKRHEFHEKHPWTRNEELHRFLLDVPYLLYFGVVPSRLAISEFLKDGGGGGGMSPGVSWVPFEITDGEYWEVVERWDQMDLVKERADGHFRSNPRVFVPDHEFMNIPRHGTYFRPIFCRPWRGLTRPPMSTHG